MKYLFLPSILFFSALATSAGEVAAPALLNLEKKLTDKQKEKTAGTVSPEQFQIFLEDFRPELAETTAQVSPSPENTAAHARILVLLGEHAKATVALNKALEKTPGDATLKLSLGQTQLESKDYAGALTTANEILKTDPSNKNALFLKNQSEGRFAPSDADRRPPMEPAGMTGSNAGPPNDRQSPPTTEDLSRAFDGSSRFDERRFGASREESRTLATVRRGRSAHDDRHRPFDQTRSRARR